MAIGLLDIKKSKKNLKPGVFKEKDKALRPWEAYDTGANQTRTVGAQEAVRKAREIVENNNLMVQKLKMDVKKEIFVHQDNLVENENSQNSQEEKIPAPIKVKSKSGIFGLFRDMLEF